MADYVINGKEMTKRQFTIWLGKAMNLSRVKALKKVGYTNEKIAEITGWKPSLVERYSKITIEEL